MPLTQMLKKNSLVWSAKLEKAFTQLKNALCTALVLALPNFQKTFIVKADACHKGMGAVLMQEGKVVAFFSKAFGESHLGMSIYEKEYLSIINAVEKWKPYLLRRHFVIKTEHQSLKLLMEQKIIITIQHKGFIKLLGLDFSIQYKRGKDNGVAGALSRREVEFVVNDIIEVVPKWIEEIMGSYKDDEWAQKNLATAMADPNGMENISVARGLLKYKGRLYIRIYGSLRAKIMEEMHNLPLGRHSSH